MQLDAGRQPELDFRQLGFDGVDGFDDVGVGLLVDEQHDAALGAVPAGETVVDDAVGHGRDVAEANGGAVAPGQHDVAIFGGLEQLVVGFDGEALAVDRDRALRQVLRCVDDGDARRFQRQVHGGEPRRRDLDAHRASLGAADDDPRDARQLRQLWRDHAVGEAVDLAGREHVAGQRERHDRGARRVRLPIGRRPRSLRQIGPGRVDGGLDRAGGGIEIDGELELHRDAGAAHGAEGGDFRHPRDQRERGLERLRQRIRDRRRARAGEWREDPDRGPLHRWKRGNRQTKIGDATEQEHADHQQRRRHRPQHELRGDAHGAGRSACGSTAGSSAEPDCHPNRVRSEANAR